MLGLQLKDGSFCKAVLVAMLQSVQEERTCPGPTTIKHAYERTEHGSPLRKVIVHIVLIFFRSSWFTPDTKGLERYPVEFIWDVLKAFEHKCPPERTWVLADTVDELCTETDQWEEFEK